MPLQISSAASLELREGEDDLSCVESALRPIEEMPRDDHGRVLLDLPLGQVYEGKIPTNFPMAPGALRHVEVEASKSWTNRTILEIVAMLLALATPHVAIFYALSERDAVRFMPLSSLVGGVLLILVGMSAPHYTFHGLRAAKPRFILEALLVCALFIGAAIGWTAVVNEFMEVKVMMAAEWSELRDLLGIPLLLAVMAAGPALFEELAFRGLLQGRLSALLGRTTGIGVTAAFFALAHGISWASPLHLTLGLYLGFLRDRSGSLIPGMLVHFFYNATLVILYTVGG